MLKTKEKPRTKTASQKSLPPRPRTKPAATGPVGYIGILTDASGSMEPIVTQTIQAFNTYIIDTAKALKGSAINLRVCQFSGVTNYYQHGTLREVFKGALSDGFKLSRENYICNGGTPLIDACCDMIDRAKEFAGRKIIVIQTDGEENASRRFNKDDLKQRVAQAEADGWQIVFLGTGMNGFSEAQKYGFSNVGTVSLDAAHMTRGTTMLASKTANFMFSGAPVGYTTAERGVLGEAAFTGPVASAAAGAAADAPEIKVSVQKKVKK